MSQTAATACVEGMGAIPHENGVAFRVWAPHAKAVSVVGDFNQWDDGAHPLSAEDQGYWYADVSEASIGDEYKFCLETDNGTFHRVDPYAREVTNSVGNGVIADPEFDWADDDFPMPPVNEQVIYEMHIGTFGRSDDESTPGNFDDAISQLDYLQKLGVNCVEVMPVAEFAGDYSWGYNPAHIFAVESIYGGPKAFKRFVKEAHQRGIAVILDVVYNHFGPSDLDLWQFDGWSENGMGGIYFYNDWRSETPWGNTRPDYGRGEVRQYIRDNALMWLKDYHVDGLRFDMTLYIRHVRGDGDPGAELPEGWSLTQWINEEVRERFPGKLTIAEDLRSDAALTQSPAEGGAGFHLQWDENFVHPLRDVVSQVKDEHRSIGAICSALEWTYNGDAFQRVVYSESHDETANGKSRVPSEVAPDDPSGWAAQKRSALAAGIVLTAPGVPMLFQGQEFLEDGWFQDGVPLDWEKAGEHSGLVKMHADLIRLRRNLDDRTRGLSGSGLEILHADELGKVLAYRRWYHGGPGDDVMVVANFSVEDRTVTIRFPQPGHWRLEFNSDAAVYSEVFGNTEQSDLNVDGSADGPVAELNVPAYGLLIFSLPQEPEAE